MCKFFASLFGLVNDESMKKQIEDLRKELISENEERLLDEKWKRSEQRDQIDQLKSKISELERKQLQGKIVLHEMGVGRIKKNK
jgi:lipid A disaccharide synthetase